MPRVRRLLVALVTAALAVPASAQTFAVDDPIIRAIWSEGTDRSQVERLAQTLADSIGPRLTGSPGMQISQDWIVGRYRAWGIEARNEQYGTWKGWRRGYTHLDLVRPRVRSLDAMLLAWSPGTQRAVEAQAVLLPDAGADLAAWRRSARGKFVLTSMPQPTCRPIAQWAELGGDSMSARLARETAGVRDDWNARVSRLVQSADSLNNHLAGLGVAGVITSNWTGGYGAHRVFGVRENVRMPFVAVDCEDYGLIARLAENGQSPTLRLDARAEDLGTVPVANTIGVIRGSELPDEYVMLSAHLDTWDAASGATDNGTGTVIMMEAMRILRSVLPNPRRTVIVGHWSGEEQGLNGSRAFAHDHPEIVNGMQALFNQDNGTGAIARVSMQGLTGAGSRFVHWLSYVPSELSGRIELTVPGTPGGGGSDYASFICHGAPAFSLGSDSWDYFATTWHTNLDTFDKVALQNVRENAILVATLAYAAAQDEERTPRDRRSVMPTSQQGQPGSWPTCRDGMRSWSEYAR